MEGGQIARALDVYQYQLKGVSLLPRAPHGAYAQLPYEAISEDQYAAALHALTPLSLAELHGENPPAPDNFCDADACETPPPG